MEYCQEEMENKIRTVNGTITTVTDEFNKLIQKRPDLLKKHILLNYLYKVDGEEVVLKTADELMKDKENMLSNSSLNDQDKATIQDFYEKEIELLSNNNTFSIL